jgi:hypothetical protein
VIARDPVIAVIGKPFTAIIRSKARSSRVDGYTLNARRSPAAAGFSTGISLLFNAVFILSDYKSR